MRALRAAGAALLAVVLAAHVGSPDVFFTGRVGPYELRVSVRPPNVVPGIARVSVRASDDVRRVSIRPVYWRAGSRGAPAADPMRRVSAGSQTFEGSLWLMARGAYSVDLIVDGEKGRAHVLVPVASVATGRLSMNPRLRALLVVLGVVLVAGLVNIVYKASGESLVQVTHELDAAGTRKARQVAAVALPIIALIVLGGANWWRAVDEDYGRTVYRPSPLKLSLNGRELRVAVSDTLWQPQGRPSPFVRDHGKLMHLFLVRDDGRAFAHLHPQPLDSSALPALATSLPPLPAGMYHVYGDVVHETGFERTLVGSLTLPKPLQRPVGSAPLADRDDGGFVGDAARDKTAALHDAQGSVMSLVFIPGGVARAGREETIRVTVRDSAGKPAVLEPYLDVAAHAVIARVDGAVYVHLHPMGTVTMAAQDVFVARDRGDTTKDGRLLLAQSAHAVGVSPRRSAPEPSPSVIEFPYAFPKGGDYRLFVQVKKDGQVLTGAFAVTVADAERRR